MLASLNNIRVHKLYLQQTMVPETFDSIVNCQILDSHHPTDSASVNTYNINLMINRSFANPLVYNSYSADIDKTRIKMFHP